MQVIIEITQREVDEYNALYFSRHPRATKLRIKKPAHPSLNEYVTANNMRGNNLKQTWKDFIIFVLEKKHLLNYGIKKCEITYQTYFGDRRRHDEDNITPKYIFDAFVEARFLIDDNYTNITKLTTEAYMDLENPRIVFIVDIVE